MALNHGGGSASITCLALKVEFGPAHILSNLFYSQASALSRVSFVSNISAVMLFRPKANNSTTTSSVTDPQRHKIARKAFLSPPSAFSKHNVLYVVYPSISLGTSRLKLLFFESSRSPKRLSVDPRRKLCWEERRLRLSGESCSLGLESRHS